MEQYLPFVIKSFKHDGHLHRKWLENWLVPPGLVRKEHADESMLVLINSQTPIQESDGKQWVSRIPAVSFFIPKMWFNVVALIEDAGVRYYCNVASPPYQSGNVITYIDYDLDVIRMPDGSMHVVDQEEYDQHKVNYHYSDMVDRKVRDGLDLLVERVSQGTAPFNDEAVRAYYEAWKQHEAEVSHERAGDEHEHGK